MYTEQEQKTENVERKRDCSIFDRVESCFCSVFGDDYKNKIDLETSMDSIVEWDSLSYIDFVCELEDEFEIEFTETESAQMFQIQHIIRIIDSIINHKPHDDVKHAYAQMQLILENADSASTQIVILSGSSTREGFVPLKEMQSYVGDVFDDETIIYNISVSGLVIAEMLQIVESLQHVSNLKFVIGFSPIILFGCGMNEFNRSCQYERFSMSAPHMLKLLGEHGYQKTSAVESQSVADWCTRFISNTSLEDLRYSPYKYPTLKPWDEEKLADEESILRYYNNAPLNYVQSHEINLDLLKKIIELSTINQPKLMFLNLTLHSKTLAFLEELGELASQTSEYIEQQTSKGNIVFIDAVDLAQLNDQDYRDPGHIYVKQDKYTFGAIKAIKQCLDEME